MYSSGIGVPSPYSVFVMAGLPPLFALMLRWYAASPVNRVGRPVPGWVRMAKEMLLLGGFLGCLFYPYLADKLSRKTALTAAVAFFDIGAVIQTAAPNYGTLVAGRAIGGIGVGKLAMGAPLYISEIAPAKMHGSLLVLEELTIVVGDIAAYWVTYGTEDMAGEASFRLPFGRQTVPATLLGAGIHLFPYSPCWLVMADCHEDFLQALSKLRRLPQDNTSFQTEWHGIIDEVGTQRDICARKHPGKVSTD